MAGPYSQDLRDRVLAAYDRGMQTNQIVKTFEVSRSWAKHVKQRRRQIGKTTALPMGGVRVVKIDLVKLRELVAAQPDATIFELHERLGAACGWSAVAMALVRLNLTYKKRQFTQPSKTGQMSRQSGWTGKPANRPGR